MKSNELVYCIVLYRVISTASLDQRASTSSRRTHQSPTLPPELGSCEHPSLRHVFDLPVSTRVSSIHGPSTEPCSCTCSCKLWLSRKRLESVLTASQKWSRIRNRHEINPRNVYTVQYLYHLPRFCVRVYYCTCECTCTWLLKPSSGSVRDSRYLCS